MAANNDIKVDNNEEDIELITKVEFADVEIEEGNCKDDTTYKCVDDDNEEIIAIPPDGGWGWIIVFASFLIFLITEGIVFAFGIFFQVITMELKFTRSQISLIGAVKASSICLSGPFSAALINTYGYRFVGIIGAILAGLSTAVSPLYDNIIFLLMTFSILSGIGYGMLYVAAVIVVGFYFERLRSLATGISLCGAGIGCTIVPPILTLILHYCGWRITFLIKGLIVLICGLCASTFKPLKPIANETTNSRLSLEKTCSNFEDESFASKVKCNFFDRYHNTSFPTLAEMKSSTLTILLPEKTDRCESSVTVFMPKYSRKGISNVLSTLIESDLEGSNSRLNICSKLTCSCTICCNKLKRESNKQVSLDNGSMSARPLYRDDIFYHGSMNLIPEYRKSMQSKTISTKSKITNYSMSVSRIVTQGNLITGEKTSKLCSKHIKIVLATMLDIRLIKMRYFSLLILNALFSSFGFFTPFLFIKDRGLDNGLTEDECFWLISTIGATNTIGRILFGAIVLIPKLCPIKLTALFLTIGGISTMLSEISFAVWFQFLYAAIYGLSIASISTLRTIIIVQVLGLSKLTNAIGMIMLAQGIATLVGVWIGGLLRDLTGYYKATFHVAGISIVISGLILFCVRKIPNNMREDIQEVKVDKEQISKI